VPGTFSFYHPELEIIPPFFSWKMSDFSLFFLNLVVHAPDFAVGRLKTSRFFDFLLAFAVPRFDPPRI